LCGARPGIHSLDRIEGEKILGEVLREALDTNCYYHR
jgi:hypothetical protein